MQPPVYSISGVKHYRKYNRDLKTWVYIRVSEWRHMSASERSVYWDKSISQVRYALCTGQHCF